MSFKITMYKTILSKIKIKIIRIVIIKDSVCQKFK